MKFASPLVFLFIATFSLNAYAHGSFSPLSSTIKAKQSAKNLKVKNREQAAQMAKNRFGGKVLKVQKQKSGYRVKLFKADGHIVSVYVDAKTGRISGGK